MFWAHSLGLLFLFLLGVFSAVDAEEVGVSALDAEEVGVSARDDGEAGVSAQDEREAPEVGVSNTDSGDAGVPVVTVDGGEASELVLSIFFEL